MVSAGAGATPQVWFSTLEVVPSFEVTVMVPWQGMPSALAPVKSKLPLPVGESSTLTKPAPVSSSLASVS